MTINTEFSVGEKVYDDLTRTEQTVIGVDVRVGVCDGRGHAGVVVGYWLDHHWLGGGRHPWEITKLVQPEPTGVDAATQVEEDTLG